MTPLPKGDRLLSKDSPAKTSIFAPYSSEGPRFAGGSTGQIFSAPVQPSRSSSSSSSVANAGLQHIRDNIFAPLLQKAASHEKDDVAIYTLLGVGTHLRMGAPMLNALPDVLRMSPAERGALGNVILQQFQAELNKHL